MKKALIILERRCLLDEAYDLALEVELLISGMS